MTNIDLLRARAEDVLGAMGRDDADPDMPEKLGALRRALDALGDAVELPAVTGRESWRSAWVTLGRVEGRPSVQAGLTLASDGEDVEMRTKVLVRTLSDEAHGKVPATPELALGVLERRLLQALADVRALGRETSGAGERR